MSELSFKDLLTELVNTFKQTVDQWAHRATGLEKTFLTKDITLQDWNSLIVLLTQTEAYVRAIAPVVEGFEELGNAFINSVNKEGTLIIGDASDMAEAASQFSNNAKFYANAAQDSATVAQNARLSNADLDAQNRLVLTYQDGSTITIGTSLKGETGPQGIQGVQGPQGERGEGFSIQKVYTSKAQMDSHAGSDGVPVGGFVIISSNVEDEDNAKVYVKADNSKYNFVSDLSGATGIRGPQGKRGSTWFFGDTLMSAPTGSEVLDGDFFFDTRNSHVYVRSEGNRWDWIGTLKGEQGDPGEAGYTPQKGVDYFTDADIAEVVTRVLSVFPVYNGEVVPV